jgi:hypothetical protein
MKRLLASFLPLIMVACAPGDGDPRPTDMPTVVLRADPGTAPATAAAALAEGNPRVALVAGPADPAWFGTVASAAGLAAVSGPGVVGPDLGLAFLGPEAVGDTTIVLEYAGGSFTLQDALYDLGQRRFLDLLAFRVESAAVARPTIGALTDYIATDVMPGAAVILAVAVPDAAAGDSVARLLSPAYRGVVHCGGSADAVAGAGIRLFFGPDARIFCRSAGVTSTAGIDRVHADLVVGRRR